MVSVTLLGTGTSTGVPVLTCKCAVCRSKHPRNKRLRASAWVQARGKSFVIDTSTDFRQQAFRARIPRVDFVLYTHPHTDHIAGIDELRAYNFSQKSDIPLYAHDWTVAELHQKYEYIFNPGPVEGGGIPHLTLHSLDPQAKQVDIQGVPIIPISLKHGSREVVGYRIESVAYVTDCSYISRASLDRLRGLSVLILDCLRIEPHGTHFNLDQALQTVNELRPRKTFLTHVGHGLDYVKWSKKLPPGVHFAYDGLKIQTKGRSS